MRRFFSFDFFDKHFLPDCLPSYLTYLLQCSRVDKIVFKIIEMGAGFASRVVLLKPQEDDSGASTSGALLFLL
jgi:hypothetical protein